MNSLINSKKKIFILGSPRSGTTWLFKMMAAHPNIAAHSAELTNFSRYVSSILRLYEAEEHNFNKNGISYGLFSIWNKTELDDFISDFLSKIYSKIPLESHTSHILDKRPDYCFYTDLIYRYYPDAKIIHIIRDGRFTTVSMMNARKKKGFGADNMLEAAYSWKRCILAAQEASEMGNKHYIEVKYEILMENTEEELSKLFSFCELSFDSDLIQHISYKYNMNTTKLSVPNHKISYNERISKDFSWKKHLSLSQRMIFVSISGDLLIKLGYVKNHKWIVIPMLICKMYTFVYRMFFLIKRGVKIYQRARQKNELAKIF